MNNETLVQLIVLTPFLSTAALYLLRKMLPAPVAGAIGSAAILACFAATTLVWQRTATGDAFTVHLADWMTGAGLDVRPEAA